MALRRSGSARPARLVEYRTQSTHGHNMASWELDYSTLLSMVFFSEGVHDI